MPPARRSTRSAKLLGFGYPGGPVIDRLAPHGNPLRRPLHLRQDERQRARFQFQRPQDRRAALGRGARSGSRNRRAPRAAARAIPRPSSSEWLAVTPQATLDLLASFQHAVIHELLTRAAASAESIGARSLIVSGGVACNSGLARRRLRRPACPIRSTFPSFGLSTDNAAMIAAAAFPKLQRGEFSSLEIGAQANLTLA